MRESTRAGVLASLAVLAVALAAATLDSTVVPEGPRGSGPDGVGGEGSGGLLPVPRSGPSPAETVQVPFLSELLLILTVVVALAVIVYAFAHWRRTLAVLATAAVLIVLAFVLFQFLSPPSVPARPSSLAPGNGSIFGGGGGEPAETNRPSPPSTVLLFVLGLALLGAVVALVRTRTTADEDDGANEGSSDGGAEAAALGRAAGRAADRIEGETESVNEVYRTWREMTGLLDVEDPGTSTPGEFADAAVEAGLGQEDVAELTRLFEDVRYGETRPSEEHERRALAVFRRIEDRYAGEDP
jgi:hypothetical protein